MLSRIEKRILIEYALVPNYNFHSLSPALTFQVQPCYPNVYLRLSIFLPNFYKLFRVQFFYRWKNIEELFIALGDVCHSLAKTFGFKITKGFRNSQILINYLTKQIIRIMMYKIIED